MVPDFDISDCINANEELKLAKLVEIIKDLGF